MPKSRGRKRRPPRPTTSTPCWQADVLRSAATLLDAEVTRHDAELWACRLLGAVSSSRSGIHRRLARQRWLDDLSAHADRRRSPRAAATLKALSFVLLHERGVTFSCPDWVDAKLSNRPWASAAPLLPRAARRSCDVWEDTEVWLLEYDDHTLVAMTGRMDGRRLLSVMISREGLHRTWDAMVPPDDAFLGRTHPVPLEEAAAVVRRAVLLADGLHHRAYDDESLALLPLLAARTAALGVPPAPYRLALPREFATELGDEFLAASGLQGDPDAEELLEHVLSFTETWMPGEPLSWSPGLVLSCLAALPDEDLDEELAERAAAFVDLWAEWALRRKGLAEHHVAPARRVAELLADEFRTWCLEVRAAAEHEEDIA